MLAVVLVATMLAPGPNPHLNKAHQQLAASDAAGALVTLKAALTWPGNTSKTLGEVHQSIGLARAALADDAGALEAFKTALDLSPDLRLPGEATPKVRELWARAGGAPEPVELKQPAAADLKLPDAPPPAPQAAASGKSSSSKGWLRIAGIAGLAAGGISVVGGGIFGGLAQQSYQRAAGATTASALSSEWEVTAGRAQTANGLYAVGASLLLIGIALFVVSVFLE